MRLICAFQSGSATIDGSMSPIFEQHDTTQHGTLTTTSDTFLERCYPNPNICNRNLHVVPCAHSQDKSVAGATASNIYLTKIAKVNQRCNSFKSERGKRLISARTFPYNSGRMHFPEVKKTSSIQEPRNKYLVLDNPTVPGTYA